MSKGIFLLFAICFILVLSTTGQVGAQLPTPVPTALGAPPVPLPVPTDLDPTPEPMRFRVWIPEVQK